MYIIHIGSSFIHSITMTLITNDQMTNAGTFLYKGHSDRDNSQSLLYTVHLHTVTDSLYILNLVRVIKHAAVSNFQNELDYKLKVLSSWQHDLVTSCQQSNIVASFQWPTSKLVHNTLHSHTYPVHVHN